MRFSLETVFTGLLTLAALTMAGTMVRREYFPSPRSAEARSARPPEYVEGWEGILPSGIHVGAVDAPVKIVEFADLECPFCSRYHTTLANVKRQFGDSVALVFVHLPLSFHRFARPAARAVECADQAGRAMEFISVVYEKQDSLGLKPWTSYANEAGIADTMRIEACAMDVSPVPRIEEGVALSDRFGVDATPTILVNGWRFEHVPNETELVRAVNAVLAGRGLDGARQESQSR